MIKSYIKKFLKKHSGNIDTVHASKCNGLIKQKYDSYVCEKGPSTVNLELTLRCNLNCKMCQRSFPGFELPLLKDMDIKTVENVLPILSDADCVWLSGFGEPLMHPMLTSIVTMINSVNSFAKVAFTTNLILMSDRKIHELIDAGLKLVQVSMDGENELGHAFSPTKEGVEKYTAVLWDRLNALERIKQGRGTNYPELQFCFVGMRRNIDQLKSIIASGIPVGLKSIVVQPIRDYNGNLKDDDLFECRDYALPLLQAAKVFAEDNGIEFICRFMDEKMSVVRTKCNFPSTFFHVAVDGKVFMCCEGIPAQLNVNDFSAGMIWNSEEYLRLRQELSTGGMRKKCWQCPLVSPTTNDEDVLRRGMLDMDKLQLIEEIMVHRHYIATLHSKCSQENVA